MTKRLLGTILVVLFGIQFQPLASASTLQLEAPKVFEQSVTHELRLSEERGEIELEVGELFEDDGPASGHSYQQPENRETVTSQTWIKKELLIPNPQARAAHLVVLSDAPVEALINGITLNFQDFSIFRSTASAAWTSIAL